jgi:hypothetical protein
VVTLELLRSVARGDFGDTVDYLYDYPKLAQARAAVLAADSEWSATNSSGRRQS